MMKSISCLVISKSYKLLNSMLESLDQSRKEWATLDEVICSWNGSEEDEQRIRKGQRVKFRIGQRVPYHFAKNINSLVKQATGEYILIINDDVILDKHSIDKSIRILEEKNYISIVGGLLRTTNKTISHAGVLLNSDLMPYNRCRPEFGDRINLNDIEVKRSGQITAVTGALILISKEDLIKVPMRETFSHCCEDIALCLDVLVKLNKGAYYSSEVTGIHNEKSTRGETDDVKDFESLKKLVKRYKIDNPNLWSVNTLWQAHEGEWLRNICYEEFKRNHKEEVLLIEKEYLIQKKTSEINALEVELNKTIESWNLDRQLLLAGQQALKKRINEIESSMSWKITQPIRYMLNRLRERLT